MKAITKIKTQLNELRAYDRSIKLFLTIPILFGMYFAIKSLFFNFYILALGADKAYLGLANGMTPAATLILAFPIGVLTDRIGWPTAPARSAPCAPWDASPRSAPNSGHSP